MTSERDTLQGKLDTERQTVADQRTQIGQLEAQVCCPPFPRLAAGAGSAGGTRHRRYGTLMGGLFGCVARAGHGWQIRQQQVQVDTAQRAVQNMEMQSAIDSAQTTAKLEDADRSKKAMTDQVRCSCAHDPAMLLQPRRAAMFRLPAPALAQV